ncbi:MAG: hypothetical protein IPG21_16800 [Saprospiraceae bacterium]|nr:hypothetical protein [Candidatus Vicinibacter affinis]MBK6823487.1 hypothetical protein [Candidatus Vicinibacter affinis]MBK7693465.1 hypothetical protein [Candidatus Vicinibacter affinis]MBK8403213.1 hypothetical protein [Candidatus Vicinibacter affinis]MBK8644433.1 hypothetical protein [Candidatus Vicinibacter affinis]
MGNKSVDDFLYTLSQKLNKSWVTESWGKSMDLVGGIRLNYIPIATSGDYTSIEIIINDVKYKIRLE